MHRSQSGAPRCPRRMAIALVTFLVYSWLAIPAFAIDEIRLVGGDSLHVTIVEETEGVVVFDHPALGRIQMSRDRIVEIILAGPPEEDAESAAAPPDATEDGAPTDPPAAEEVTDVPEMKVETMKHRPWWRTELDRWDVSLDFALTSVSGNTDEQTLRFGANATRNTLSTVLRWDLSYYWKASDGDTTDNKLTTGVSNRWLMPNSPWFWFVAGRYDFDQFESWRQRISGHGGPGYHLIQNEFMEWDALVGFGTRKEFGSQNDDWRPEGSIGTTFKWKLTDRQSIELDAFFFPVVTDLDDYRIRSQGKWVYLMSRDYNLGLNIGYLFEYQSIVDPGKEREDLRIFAGIQLSF